jgi:hypothetical protein
MGCFYGDSVVLGGEKEFSHCYDFFSGIGDVEWWITEEIEKLTEEQKERMYSILVRNKSVNTMLEEKRNFLYELADELGIGSEYIARLGNKLKKELIESDNPIEKYKEFLADEKILNKLSFDNKTYKVLAEKLQLPPKKDIGLWYIDGNLPKFIKVHKDTIKILRNNGIRHDDVLMKDELEELLGIVL